GSAAPPNPSFRYCGKRSPAAPAASAVSYLLGFFFFFFITRRLLFLLPLSEWVGGRRWWGEGGSMRRTFSHSVDRFCVWVAALTCARAADPGFQKWLQDLWPQAQALGVSRATFDAATRALEPDLTLPDLDLPGREGAPPRGQAEFVQTPADYIRE